MKKFTAVMCFAAIVAVCWLLYAFSAFGRYSKKTTVIDLPENLKYDFCEYDSGNFVKNDEVDVDHVCETGEKITTKREYFSNEKTGEKLVKISNKSDGKFIKGYCFSNKFGCVYYPDGTMKLFGEKTGKVYCFKNSELKYISEISVCKRLYSSVYVITYYNSGARRIAVETQTAYDNGNVRAVRFLYDRHYDKNFIPISRKKFEKLLTV